MTELCFYYYGATEDVARHFLTALGLLAVRAPTEDLKGFYVSEKRYGQESFRRLVFGIQEFRKDEALLVYRYLSDSETEWLNQNPQVRLYVLLHKLIDLSYLHELFKDKDQCYFIADFGAAEQKVRPFHEVRRQFDSKKIIRLAVRHDEELKEQKKERFQWPVFFLLLVNALVNPIGELKRYSVHLKYSNLRVLHRSLELIIFLHYILVELFLRPLFYAGMSFLGGVRVILIKTGFLFRHLLLMMGFKSFGVFVDSWNFVARSRIVFIKIGYFFRHILLMMGFKSFGMAVDTTNLVLRLKAPLIRFYYLLRHGFLFVISKSYGLLVNLFYLIESLKIPLLRLGYGLRHIVLMSAFKFYGLAVDVFHIFVRIKDFIWGLAYYKIYLFLHYRVFYFLRFQVWHFFRYGVFHFVKYNILHWILMGLYKTYGAFYDLAMFAYRFTKLILLWPIFKIYWFSEFQYKKRLKKYFTHDI